MSYTILKSDGTVLVTLADKKQDKSTTSLTLTGKNYSGYGEELNNNLVKLMTNFASPTAPRNPQKGQLWYDTTSKRLKVYDTEYKSVTGAIVAGGTPSDLTSGDIWWDTTNEQLKVAANNTVYIIGPIFPKLAGENGFVLPNLIIKDFDNVSHDVTLIKNFGSTLGFISNDNFTFSTSSNYSYITATTTSSVAGLTVLGTVQITGSVIVGGSPPASQFASGKKGEMRVSGGYLYICTATNSWTKISLSW